MTQKRESKAGHTIKALTRLINYKVLTSIFLSRLCVQLDNCSREYKNKFFPVCIDCLVVWSNSAEEEASYLQDGYKHADMAEPFCLAFHHLRHNRAVTLRDLHY